MKILLVGGGTGGSVTPLLAVAQEILKLKPKTTIVFVGTNRGPEKAMVSDFGIPFQAIPAAKLRRYFSLKNIVDVIVFIVSLFKAWLVLRKFRPNVIFGVGSYVQVPICWIGKLLGVKVVIHQQDAEIGLANKLVSPFADKITTTFAYTAKAFYSNSGIMTKKWKTKAEWVGNPYRAELVSNQSPNRRNFGLHDQLPVLLILGGSSGAAQVNSAVFQCLDELIKSHQIIHQTGIGKKVNFSHPDYHAYDFLPYDQCVAALKLADIVIARAGMATLTELSVLGKIAIIVPMPDSHQELNARIVANTAAAVVLFSDDFNPETLPRIVTSIKFNLARQKLLAHNISQLMPKESAAIIAKLILKEANGK